MTIEHFKTESSAFLLDKADQLLHLYHSLQEAEEKVETLKQKYPREVMQFRRAFFPLKELEEQSQVFSKFENSTQDSSGKMEAAQALYGALLRETEEESMRAVVQEGEDFLKWFKAQPGNRPTPAATAFAA